MGLILVIPGGMSFKDRRKEFRLYNKLYIYRDSLLYSPGAG